MTDQLKLRKLSRQTDMQCTPSFARQFSFRTAWHWFNEVPEWLIWDFGPYGLGSITRAAAGSSIMAEHPWWWFLVPPHLKRSRSGGNVKATVVKFMMWDLWRNILLKVTMWVWALCGHKGIDMVSIDTEVEVFIWRGLIWQIGKQLGMSSSRPGSSPFSGQSAVSPPPSQAYPLSLFVKDRKNNL